MIKSTLWVGAAALLGWAVTASAKAPPWQADSPSFRYRLDLDPKKRTALADQKRDEAIAQLQRILPSFDDRSSEKPDLLFQLAELYWEKSKYLYALEMERYDEAYKAFEEAKSRSGKAGLPKAEHIESERYRQETMRLYDRILAEFPHYARTDEVLFFLGNNLQEVGKREIAARRYEDLIRRFPKSSFVPDAYIQLGDHHFDQNRLGPARENYEQAFASNVPKIHSYALYKLAWCDYNAGDYEGALKKLKDVVEFAEQFGNQMVDLKNEALNDQVVVYVQLNRVEDPLVYFSKKAPTERQSRLIAKLAEGLAEAGRHENAIRIYRWLVERDPTGPKAPEFQQAVVKSYEGLRQRDRVKAEVRKLAELYRPGAAWWRANEANPGVLKDAFTVAEEAMRTLVTDYHQEAQRTKQVDTYRLARDIYRQYLDAFASSPDETFVADQAFNLRFYYAEILWTLEEWEAAAEQYDAVVSFKVPSRASAREVSDERFRKLAAKDAILAYDKLLKIERGELASSNLKDGQKVEELKGKGGLGKTQSIHKKSTKDLVEQPLTRFEQKLANACDAYAKLYPGDPEEIEIRYQAAVLYYDRDHFVESAKRFGEIIQKWPEDRRSKEAAELAMAILDSQQQWYELSRLSAQFLANQRLTKPGTEFARKVERVVEGSRYKWIDEVLNKKNHDVRRAASELVAFVRDFPRSQAADRALAYAMWMYQELGQLDRAAQMGERELKEFPSSPLELKVRYTLAGLREKMAEYEKSAQLYDSFVASFDRQAEALAAARRRTHQAGKAGQGNEGPDQRQKEALEEREHLIEEARAWLPDAQYNAGVWWEATGQVEKAVAAYRRYIRRFHDRKDVPDIQYGIGLLYERERRWPEAIGAFESFDAAFGEDPRVERSRRVVAKYHLIRAHQALGHRQKVQALSQELIRLYGRLPSEQRKDDAALLAYAHARFLAVEPLWEEFTAIRFVRVSTIQRDLEAKRRKLKELERAYGQVLAIGAGEVGIAALTRIGMAYADLASNITRSPTPKGLDADQTQMYRAELTNLSAPLEAKAVEALEKGLGKAYELGIYGEWTVAAQDSLTTLKEGSYPPAHPVELQTSQPFVLSLSPIEPTVPKASPPAPISPEVG